MNGESWDHIFEFGLDEHDSLCGVSYINVVPDVEYNSMRSSTYPIKKVMGGRGGSHSCS